MTTKGKVYTFYICAILVMVLVLAVFNLNLIAKAIIGLMIVFCVFVMRSIRNAYPLADDIDPDTMLPIESVVGRKSVQPKDSADRNSNIDLYLRLLIEADEELSKDPEVDQMSPIYNIQLNNRIAERLDALDKAHDK